MADIVDKKSGALIILDCKCYSCPLLHAISHVNLIDTRTHPAETKTERGELVAINQFSVFIIGAGGFGGKRQSSALKVGHLGACSIPRTHKQAVQSIHSQLHII